MISLTLLRSLSADLETFRSKAAKIVMYDHGLTGNYGNYEVEKIWNKLEAHDPTGFASALLLDEMIENVINGSDVRLSRVLREPGFLDKVNEVLTIKSKLAPYIDEPRATFVSRLAESLKAISPDDAAPSTLEVAVCMRDAIYAIDGGLKLRWMRCNTAVGGDMALCHTVRHYKTMPEFIESLMSELPHGAHLACINGRFTVIGLKNPGRIAYLSTLSIDRHTGKYMQGESSQYNAAQFDLAKPAERYPNWNAPAARHDGAVAVVGQEGVISKLSQLKRDQIIWLALVVEMTRQEMERTDATTIALTETMTNALAGANKTSLPALRVNYVMQTRSIAELFDSYGFNEWTRNFLQPAIDELTIDHMLPITNEPVSFRISAREHTRTLTQTELYGFPGGSEAYLMDYVSMHTISPSLAGTQAEVEEIRNWVLGRNLLSYLMAYMNTRFVTLFVTECFATFKKRIEKNLGKAILSNCARVTAFNNTPGGVYFYKQSGKHKTYNPRCYFDEFATPTHTVFIEPINSAEIAEVMGLKSEKDLPEFIRGWVRTPDDERGFSEYGLRKEWAWNSLYKGQLGRQVDALGLKALNIPLDGCFRATVAINAACVPELSL
jgi:hypothetical protein